MAKPRPRFNFEAGIAGKPAPAQQGAEVSAPQALPAASAPAGPDVPAAPRKAATRVGKRGVTFYLSDPAWKQLKLLAIQHDRSVQEMMEEATDLLFAQHGQHRLAKGG